VGDGNDTFQKFTHRAEREISKSFERLESDTVGISFVV